MNKSMVALGVSAALTMPALADPPAFRDPAFSRSEGSVGVGLTIPFGTARQKAPPRVELRLARDVVNMDGSRQSNGGVPLMETRIGFSLERERRLLVNGRPIEKERRNNISTVGWIAIGVGVVVIGGVVLVADAARDASE
jgi:hypothetical protein